MPIPYTDAALKSELTADPAGLGYAARLAARDLDGAANALDAATAVAYSPVPMGLVLKRSGTRQLLIAIDQAVAASGPFAAGGASPIGPVAQNSARAVQYMLEGGYPYLDVTDPEIVGSVAGGAAYTPGATLDAPGHFDNLVAAKAMTQADKDALISLGKATVPRARSLWIDPPPIDAARIAAALRS